MKIFLRKFIVLVSLLTFTLIVFHSLIFKKIFISVLERATEKAISIDDININFKKSFITFNNIKIYNSDDFEYEYFFTCKKIDLKINIRTIFSSVIEFQNLIFYEPKIYLEIKNLSTNYQKDNISELEKFSPKYNPKVYPLKKKDRNIIIKKVITLKPKANLNYENNYKIENLNLSEMELNNVGNSTSNSQHFKEVFKIVLLDLYFRIPDNSIKNKLKKLYKF